MKDVLSQPFVSSRSHRATGLDQLQEKCLKYSTILRCFLMPCHKQHLDWSVCFHVFQAVTLCWFHVITPPLIRSRSPSLQTLSRNPVTVNTLTLSLWCRSVVSQVKLGIFSINISNFFVRLWEFLRQRINCTLRRFNKCTSAADEEWFQTTVLNVLHCIAAPERLHQFRFWVTYKPVAAWKEGKMLFSV